MALPARESSCEPIGGRVEVWANLLIDVDLPSRPAARRSATARIVVSENVSLDGVIQDPAGVEGFSRGGWVGRIGGQGRDEAAKVALDEALGAKTLLLGPRSYEVLAPPGPSPSGPFPGRVDNFSQYLRFSTP